MRTSLSPEIDRDRRAAEHGQEGRHELQREGKGREEQREHAEQQWHAQDRSHLEQRPEDRHA